MKHLIEYLWFKAFSIILRIMPFAAAMRFGAFIGRLVYYLLPFRKEVALLNIRTAFPEKPDREVVQILKDTYRNFAMTFFEYLTLYRLSPERILSMVEIDQRDLLFQIMGKEKGVVAITGHFGSFELMGVAVSALGIPMDVVVKPMKNPRIEKFLDDVRSKNNLGVVKTTDGFPAVVESIEARKMIALVADQDAGERGTRVKFFNIDSSTPVGPAILALRTGAPMIAGYIVRIAPARYKVHFHSVSDEELPENFDEKVREITQRYTTLLESYIERYPDHYLWFHKRWKSSGLYSSM
ncbi:lysophospholipid acyltransferase family protein [candidate division KSB1 bacterium]